MSPLRDRMVARMRCRHFSPRTEESYLHAIEQLYLYYRRMPLESARLSPGLRLPGEAVLASRLGVTRHLIRYVLGMATEEGWIARRGRSGTYLLRRPEPGSVPLLDRGWAPVGLRNRTISLVLSSGERARGGPCEDFGALKNPLVVVAEYATASLLSGVPGWIFDWWTALMDALTWVMSDHEGLTHRLYLPVRIAGV